MWFTPGVSGFIQLQLKDVIKNKLAHKLRRYCIGLPILLPAPTSTSQITCYTDQQYDWN